MKIIKPFALALTASFALTSCLDDDGSGTTPVEPTGNVDLYVTNHTNGNVTKLDLIRNSVTTYTNAAVDTEGIYYSEDDDSFTQVERSPAVQLSTFLDVNVDVDNTIDTSVSVTSSFSTDLTDGLTSPRDLAVNGNFYVVSDNAPVGGDDTKGRFFIYTRADDSFTLRNIVTVDFKVWGIEFVGNDLYAVVDTTNKLAKFTNFVGTNTTDATVAATSTVSIDGIVRTHGLAFDNGTMVLTDIGDAASDSDGAFNVITSFESAFTSAGDEGTISAGEQTRVKGASTTLGNPVSVELYSESGLVLIAELANGGGKVLGFNQIPVTGGDMTPVLSYDLTGASSMYLYEN
ncbi:MAG: hypothetical protein CL868_20705 [Cytophagaceae bacterium]|nr:hypothetical protein [Cytophagaceae bacterium]|tara:strand:+ start:5769 stop:6806 length:1038 start_codon:yes stop_codon:yes gene_type:complete